MPRRWVVRVAALLLVGTLAGGLFALFQWGMSPVPPSGPRPPPMEGVVEWAGVVDASRRLGSRQHVTVRLPDGRVVNAVVSGEQPTVAMGDRVVLWPAGGILAPQYGAVPVRK